MNLGLGDLVEALLGIVPGHCQLLVHALQLLPLSSSLYCQVFCYRVYVFHYCVYLVYLLLPTVDLVFHEVSLSEESELFCVLLLLLLKEDGSLGGIFLVNLLISIVRL